MASRSERLGRLYKWQRHFVRRIYREEMSRQPLTVLFTRKADADEEAIYNYISRKFGKIYADKFRSNIIALFEKIALTPIAGRMAKKDHSLRVFISIGKTKLFTKQQMRTS